MGLIITEKDHLKRVKCKIKKTECEATIWYCKSSGGFYLIQNERTGHHPFGDLWETHGKYSWQFLPGDLSSDDVGYIDFLKKKDMYELWEF